MFKKKVYKYFLCYELEGNDGETVIKNTDLNLHKKISSLSYIRRIEQVLLNINGNANRATIINFELLEVSKDYLPIRL